MDLAQADIICNDYVLKKLQHEAQEGNDIAQELFDAMESRILERRDKSMYGLARYLNLKEDESYDDVRDDSILPYPRKSELPKIARELYCKLFVQDDMENNYSIDKNSNTSLEPPVAKKSREEELDELLSGVGGKEPKKKELSSSDQILNLIKKEMAVYEYSGELGTSLKKLKGAIAAIPATSVEAERAFSAAGLFVTKLRTRLHDDLIDVLCFLRAHFLKEQQEK